MSQLNIIFLTENFDHKTIEECVHHFKTTQAIPFEKVNMYLKVKEKSYHMEQIASAFGLTIIQNIAGLFDSPAYFVEVSPLARPEQMDTISTLKAGLDTWKVKLVLAKQYGLSVQKPEISDMIQGEPWTAVELPENPLVLMYSTESLKRENTIKAAVAIDHSADGIKPTLAVN